MRTFLILLSLGVTAPALADDDAARAKEELEKQLQQMVRIPPPQLEIVFTGVDAADYKLVGATFTLDDQALPISDAELTRGSIVFSGTIGTGHHTLASQITYQEDPKTIFTYMSGTRFKVPGRVEFAAERGLRVHVRSGVHVDSSADLQHRLKAVNVIQPEMVAQLEDGKMPDAPKPHLETGPTAPPMVAVADATPPKASDAEAPPGAHPDKRHKRARKSEEPHVEAAVSHDRAERQVVAARDVASSKPAEPEPSASSGAADAGAPVMVAMATPPGPAAVAPSPAPAAVVEEGEMSLGAKLGLVAGVTLLVLVGLTVFFRTRR